MTDEVKVPITAKLPESLHSQLLQAVQDNRCKDKTDGIIKGLEVFLSNTVQSPLFDENVLQRITLDLQEKINKINELQAVIQKLPDPIEVARIEARNEGLHLLLEEKDRNIERLEREVNRLDSYAYYFKTKEEIKQVPSNTEVIQRNMGSEGLIKKKCKFCGNTFLTGNIRKETCNQNCRSSFSKRKMKKEN